MSSILFLSLSGSPGVTTTALAMTLTWPQSALLIEADSSRYSSILPGYLRAQVSHSRGIAELSVLSRSHGSLDVNQVWGQSITLIDEQPETVEGQPAEGRSAESLQRRLVPGFKDPAAARAMDPVWAQLGSAAASFEGMAMDVLLDAGRWNVDDKRHALLTLSDLIVVVMRPTLSDMVATHVRLPAIREQLAATGREGALAVLLVEPSSGPQKSAFEVRKALGVDPLGQIAWDDTVAPMFSSGEPGPKRPERSRYMRSLAPAVDAIRTQLARQRELLDQNLATTKGSLR